MEPPQKKAPLIVEPTFSQRFPVIRSG